MAVVMICNRSEDMQYWYRVYYLMTCSVDLTHTTVL